MDDSNVMSAAMDEFRALKARLDTTPLDDPSRVALLIEFVKVCTSLFGTEHNTTYLQHIVEYASGPAGEIQVDNPEILLHLTEAHLTRGIQLKSAPDIEQAIKLSIHALDTGSRGEVEKGETHARLGFAFMLKYNLSKYLFDVSSAVEHYKRASELLPNTHRAFPNLVRELERVYLVRFHLKGDLDDWNNSYRPYGGEEHATPDNATGPAETDVAEQLIHQANTQRALVAKSADPMAVRRTVGKFQDALDALPATDPRRLYCAAEVGRGCLTMNRVFKSVIPLNLGITQLQSVITLSDKKQDPPLARIAGLLSECYERRYEQALEVPDLEECIRHLTTAKDLTHQGEDDQSAGRILLRLSSLHCDLYKRKMRDHDLDAALQLGREALLTAERQCDEARTILCLRNLGWIYKVKSFNTNSVLDVEMAMENLVRARHLSKASPTSWDDTTKRLIGCMLLRSHHTGQVEHAEEALQLSHGVYQNMSSDCSDKEWLSGIVRNLSEDLKGKTEEAESPTTIPDANLVLPRHGEEQVASSVRLGREGRLVQETQSHVDAFLQGGDRRHIEEAIGALTELLAMGHLYRVERARYLAMLGSCHSMLFSALGEAKALDKAFECFRTALGGGLVLFGEPGRAEVLERLAEACLHRYRRDNTMADVEQAIELLREAVQVRGISDFLRTRCHHQLGAAYIARWTTEKGNDDLIEGIKMYDEARAHASDSFPDLPNMLGNYAVMNFARYRANGRRAFLDAAVQDLNKAISLMPSAHPDGLQLRCYLGVMLMNRFHHFNAVGDLDESIGHFTEVLRGKSENQNLEATCLLQLGKGHLSKYYGEDKSAVHLQSCIDYCHKVVDIPDALLDDKMEAYWYLAVANMYLDDLTAATQMIADMASLMPLLSPQFLAIPDKMHQLRKVQVQATDMAAILLINRKRIYDVLVVLEANRGVVMASLGDIRAPLSDLRKHDPYLAEDYATCRNKLERIPTHGLYAPQVRRNRTDERYKADQKLRESIEAIRKVPGFDRFLLPPTEAEMLESASRIPIVVVNISDFRSTALIIQKSGLSMVSLPRLRLQDIRRFERSLYPSQITMSLLEWLWDTVAEPILDHLGFVAPPQKDMPWPRIRWIPTGSLSRFPLHAAGYQGLHGCSVLDRVISTYSFSVTSFIRSSHIADGMANGQSLHPATSKMTVVGAGHLRSVPKEISRLAEIWKDSQVRRPEPRSRQVLESLKDCDMFHFAGHGYTSAADPLKSALVLDGDELTVSNLLDIDLQARRPFLAYLSACGTGRMRDSELLNEGLHLVATFQLVGFRHVIGTLWDVEDETCVRIAGDTYLWMQTHGIDDRSVAEGLHNAVRKLRDEQISSHLSKIQSGASDAPGKRMKVNENNSDAEDMPAKKVTDEAMLAERLRVLTLDGMKALTLDELGFQDIGGSESGNMEEESPPKVRKRPITDDIDFESDDGVEVAIPCNWIPYIHFGA